MRMIIEYILSHAANEGDNVVIFAAKPELLRYARQNNPVIGALASTPQSSWNIFVEMDASKNPMMCLREIATDLFAEQHEKTLQTFFPDAAREIFIQTAQYYYDYSKVNAKKLHNAELIHGLLNTPVKGSGGKRGWVELAEQEPKYFSMMRDYVGTGGQQGMGVLAELRNMIANTFIGSFASENGSFSATGALRKGGARIFLYYDYTNAGHSTLALYKILLDLLLKEAMNTESLHKSYFFLDEASLLPKSDTLTDALSLGRDPGSNKKGGVRIIMAIQSAKLMTRHYSETEAETLLSLFPNVVSLRVTDQMSRAVVSDRYGKARYQYSYAGVGDHTHYVDSIEDVVSDYHFSKITKKGQALMSLPGVSSHPFIYDGYIQM